jgi:hypothetical protein
MALHQTEWALQRACAAFLSKALPADAYFTSIDIGRSTSAAQGNLRRLRGVKAGIPDVLIVWQGITLWCELKAGTSLSPAQQTTRNMLQANGHHWYLCRSPEDIEGACRNSLVPLRATLGQIRERIAVQNEHLPAKKPKRASPRKPGPRYTLSTAAVRRATKRGVTV